MVFNKDTKHIKVYSMGTEGLFELNKESKTKRETDTILKTKQNKQTHVSKLQYQRQSYNMQLSFLLQ